jgi:serine/threonine protein kinase
LTAEGDLIGSRYRLGPLLGRGGMGEVYQGVRTSDGHRVAIKVLRPEYVSDRNLVARFVRERDILCNLAHHNLVAVEDLIVDGDTLAFILELVEGGDLRQRLRRDGTPTASQALEIAAQIFDALTVVHAAGVVHRDVKPENILVPNGPSLRVQLSDFGVARVTSAEGNYTTHTSLIGTPFYMAPELADDRPITPAVDVYAVGCLLYELLAGHVPFTGSAFAVLRQHAQDQPAPISELGESIQRFLDQLLAKDPTRRPSAAEAATTARALALVAPPSAARAADVADGGPLRETPLQATAPAEHTLLRRPIPQSDELGKDRTRHGDRRLVYGMVATVLVLALTATAAIALNRDDGIQIVDPPLTTTTSTTSSSTSTTSTTTTSTLFEYLPPFDHSPVLTALSIPGAAARTLSVGSTVQLAAVALWSSDVNPPALTVQWATDNANVASVDSRGLVTAKALGTATITAGSGTIQTTTKVTTFEPPTQTTTTVAPAFTMTASVYVEYPVTSCAPELYSREYCANSDIVPGPKGTTPNPALPSPPAESRYVRWWITVTNTSSVRFCPRDIWIEVHQTWGIDVGPNGNGPFGAWYKSDGSYLANRSLYEPCWGPGETRNSLFNNFARVSPGTASLTFKYTPSESDTPVLNSIVLPL